MTTHPQIEADSAASNRHIGCTMTSVLLHLVRDELGADGVAQVLREAGSARDVTFLENQDNWVSLDEAIALLAAGATLTGDPLLPRRVGEQTVRRHAGTQVATLLRSLGSPEAILASIALASGKFSTVTEMESVESAPGRGVVTACARPGFAHHPLHCQWTAGLISQATVLFGLPPATVEETECQARGGERCVYTISWDAELAAAAADPAQRVTALEAQLIAMSQRLQGVYATAGDLLSPDEIDVVLARIVERAASTVRAPRYVLAVRTAPDAELRVYCDGIEQDEAAALAQALDLGQGVDKWTAVAQVASSRRAYGQLIALNSEGAEFFPQERELLELYAKHASAVLDMATALGESARRHRDVSALLSLSEALAQAETSREVTGRLAATVPSVVDCDRTSVYLWDALERHLHPASEEARQRIQATDTPMVDEMLADHAPRFVDATTDDAFVSQLMADRGSSRMAVVPIVARDEFLGVLVVSVAERSERLAPTEDLLERLTGVAALAAPAIQNGRLIDELRHQAAHDLLTGLPNRVGFGERIDRALEAADESGGLVGLLFVDLDGFKQVNDAYGHDVGDQLLRAAAGRLANLVRSADATARLGGDEFAMILSAIESPEELDAAASRVREAFVEPFVINGVSVSVSASVGGAIQPDDGSGMETLLRNADSAMYREKQQAGRD